MLPAEIWLHIFEQLCAHCGCKEMPDFSPPNIKHEDSDYEQGKSALAALSLTSRGVKDLSQPVLYHCFYDHPYRNDMSKFLCTLISQPRLARCVKVLSLPGNKYEVDHWEDDHFEDDHFEDGHFEDDHFEHNTRDQLEAWNEASKSLGISPPKWVPGLLLGDAPGESVAFDGACKTSRLQYLSCEPEHYYRALRSWQQCLAVGLCSSSLTHLAIFDIGLCQGTGLFDECPLGPTQPPGPFNFPHLRMFSSRQSIPLEQYSSFFSQAPLLSRVATGNISCPRPESADWAPPKLLTNLQSLSFGCVEDEFTEIIGACRDVEDLEVYIDCVPWDFMPDPEPTPDLWPASLKRSVRRLCWDVNDFDGWEFIGGEGQNFFPPIQEFTKLEILEIDRISLHSHITNVRRRLGLNTQSRDEIVRQVPSILPPSIRILHLSSELCLTLTSWSTMIIELEALAAAKKTTLQRLSVIQFDVDESELRYPGFPDFMERAGVVTAMRDVGIELKFGQERRHFHRPDRGLLPQLPGNLDFFPEGNWRKDKWRKFPVNNFALED